MEILDIISNTGGYFATAIGAIVGWIAIQNKDLQSGLTNILLRRLGKIGMNQVPLEKHKLFNALKNRHSKFEAFMIEHPIKALFYRRYIDVLFDEIKDCANKIIKLSQTEDENVLDNLILESFTELMENVEKRIEESLIIPDNIRLKFQRWRAMLRDSFQESLHEFLSDELSENKYVIAHRVLDAMIVFVKTILSSGIAQMVELNGAFDKLTNADIFKK